MTARMHEVPDRLLTNLLDDCRTPENFVDEAGLLKRIAEWLTKRALYPQPRERRPEKPVLVAKSDRIARSIRSGTLLNGAVGPALVKSTHTRHANVEPQLVPMHLTRWSGFDDRILSLYARGMTVREIQSHLQEMYGADISHGLISSITDAVVEEVKEWQSRPLDPVYPIVYLDCIHVKVREGAVRMRTVYLAIGVTLAGEKEVFGVWLAQTEDADVCRQILTDLRNRGMLDVFIACVAGFKGSAKAIEAIQSAFPLAAVQICIASLVESSMNYASWKRRPAIAADLKRIYAAADAIEAERCLCEFEAKWNDELLPISQSWRRHWQQLIPLFDYPAEIRKVIYATNPMDTVNRSLRKLSKQFGAFSSDEALMKLLYLMLRSIGKKWTKPMREWKTALTRLAIQFEARMPPS